MSTDSSATPKADHRINGKFVITEDTFSRSRLRVSEKPKHVDTTIGSTYGIEYTYYDEKGNPQTGYPRWKSPVLSVVYPVAQRPNEKTNQIDPGSKYSMTLGYRVIQKNFVMNPRGEFDNRGRFAEWIDLPREFEIQDAPTGNAWRGDDVALSEKSKKSVVAFYTMLAEAQSEVRTQLARIIGTLAPPRALTYSAKMDLIKCSSTNLYQDIRSTVAQTTDKNTQEIVRMFTAQLDLEGKKTMKLDDFIQIASGARVAAFTSMCSVHLSVSDIPRVHLTIDRAVVFAPGEGPDASNRDLSLSREEFEDEEPMTAALEYATSNKRALEDEVEESVEKRPRVAESAEEATDTSVFLDA